MPDIKFGAWTPDSPSIEASMTEAKNCLWANGSYRQFTPLATAGDALASTPVGAIRVFDSGGNAYIYAGTATGLYRRSGTSWVDESSAAYSVSGDGYWRFAQFGNSVLATNLNSPLQIATVGGTFEDVSDAPRAKTIGVINNFVVLGSVITSNFSPVTLAWSAIGDPTDWPTYLTIDALSKQSSRESLDASYGEVNFISNGEFSGLAFQERGISRLDYVGGNQVFRIETYEKSRGAYTPNGNIQIDDLTYFISQDGFYVTNGQEVKPIGYGAVDNYFHDNLNTAKLHLVTVTADQRKKIIYWSYPSSSSSTPDKILAYNYADKKWTRAEMACNLLFPSVGIATSLDAMDATYASIEDVTPPFDSRYWQGGDLKAGGFSTNALADFTGTALTAVLEGTEVMLNEGGVCRIMSVFPVTDGVDVSVSVGTRDTLAGSVVYGPETSAGRTGWAAQRATGRFHRIRTTISGGFTRAYGFDVKFSGVGR